MPSIKSSANETIIPAPGYSKVTTDQFAGIAEPMLITINPIWHDRSTGEVLHKADFTICDAYTVANLGTTRQAEIYLSRLCRFPEPALFGADPFGRHFNIVILRGSHQSGFNLGRVGSFRHLELLSF